MSVLLHNIHGWVLDSCSLIDDWYSRCIRYQGSQKSRVKCRFKRQCFQILKSHFSESACAAADGGNADMLQKTDKPSKKRKRKHSELNQGEVDSQAFHEKIRSVILEGTKTLVDSARSVGCLNGTADTVKEPLPSQECSLAALCEMAKELPLVDEEEQEECVQQLVGEGGCTAHVDLFSRVTENSADSAIVVTLMGEQYVIPPCTAFLLSDFTRIQPLVHTGSKFDLIVMDPPWENKSVKRSRRYSFLPSTQLKRLPVSLLASPNCLVVTWVTNRPSHLRFVRDELYPHWGVEVVAEWFWVKVTTSGQFVFPLDSQHKKPYEVLVLGRYRPPADNSASSSVTSEVPVEDRRLIVSVPSALHSQKPSLSGTTFIFVFLQEVRKLRWQWVWLKSVIVIISVKSPLWAKGHSTHRNTTGLLGFAALQPCRKVLKPYVGGEAKYLELFARCLQPGWTSWGNEVLKFQHTSYFTLTPADEGEDVSKGEAAHECADKTPITPVLSSPGESPPPRRCPTTVD